MDDAQKKLQEYFRWYEKKYAETINLDRLLKTADELQMKWLHRAVENFNFPFSSIWRHEVLSTMRYYIAPRKIEYICTSFKIFRKGSTSYFKDPKVQYHSIYAILYSYYDPKEEKLSFEFVACCPTFKSADGEYRHRFIAVSQLISLSQRCINIFGDIEKHILKQMQDGDVSIEAEYLLPKYLETPDKILKKIKAEIDKLRLPILCYVAGFIKDFERFINGRSENHICDGYQKAMFHHNDEVFYEKILKYKEEIEHTLLLLSRFKKNPEQKTLVLEIGQKFIPLTIHDVEETNNIGLTPWREIYINNLLSNVVINGISPTFPIFNDWFFIQGNSFGFWDNKVSQIKLDHSEIASEVVKKLEKARTGTYVIDPINKQEIYLSYNMEGLSEAIEIPMDYAEQEIILADMILCTLNEHVGRTMADMPKLLYYGDYERDIGPIFKHIDVFSKYVFEFIDGLLAMNSAGVVHGDLHLNNFTLFVKRPIDPERINPKLVHIIYNVIENNYIFPHFGFNSCFIDFSRAFINRERLSQDFDENQVIAIMSQQRKRMMRVLEREIPDFVNSFKHELEVALLDNIDAAFKIFMAVDAYKLSRGMMHLIQLDVLTNKDLLKKFGDIEVIQNQIVPLLEKIHKISEHYLTNNLSLLIQRKINIDQLDNINLIIIKECFEQYMIQNFTPPLKDGESFIHLVDYFSSNNTLRYNTQIYDKFPETIKLEYVIEHKIPLEDIGYQNYQNYREYLEKEKVPEKIQQIQAEYISDKPERRGSPLYELSGKEQKKEMEKKIQKLNESSAFYYET